MFHDFYTMQMLNNIYFPSTFGPPKPENYMYLQSWPILIIFESGTDMNIALAEYICVLDIYNQSS